MKSVFGIFFVTACMLLASLAYAGETGTTRYAVDLMAAPYRDAKLASKLPENTRVEVLGRRGGWINITSKGQSGWVRLHQVRLGEGPEKKGSSGLSSLWNVGQTGRSGSQGIVATTGVRGLSAEELKAAKPNPQAVAAMDAYKAGDAGARAYAHDAGL
ncbi:MAG: SH3 domain-containing protein, partial [Gammaproteobacteria bacterium]|nr:SH3 domain-containing protein [Gammaproteobacteria bacterium]